MASGGWEPGQNRLVDRDGEIDSGAIAVLVHGDIRVRSVVSQGCRPIGRHFVITKAEQNVIQELSGQPALEQLQQVYAELSESEQALVRQGLHVGRVMNEYQDKFGRGDFLVRNVIGADDNSGAIAIGDFVKPGQTVQFNVRDAQTADEDLRALLQAGESGHSGVASAQKPPILPTAVRCCSPATAAVHDCFLNRITTRGRSRMLLGPVPLAGFFAQGEIGPVAGKNHLHGFTASVAVFEPIA